MKFFKTVSAGNDFIHLEEDAIAQVGDKRKREIARTVSARHTGAGADGVIYYRMVGNEPSCEIFNRDGSPAELSGNGLSGLAAVLFFTRNLSGDLIIHTPAGERSVQLLDRKDCRFRLRVEIGVPDFGNRAFFPFLGKGIVEYTHGGVAFHPVSTGNPHVVVDGTAWSPDMDLKAFCERLAAADLFPHGINVEVLRELSGENCRVFFHERGVGPTESSSTGSAAVFAVLRKLGRVGDHMSISSGNHQISVFAVGDRIYVENHAEIVYKGVFLSTGEK